MQLFGEEMRRNPFPIYAQFRENSPVARGPNDVSWMVFDYENVKRILDDPATYSSQESLHENGRLLSSLESTLLSTTRHSIFCAGTSASRIFTPTRQ